MEQMSHHPRATATSPYYVAIDYRSVTEGPRLFRTLHFSAFILQLGKNTEKILACSGYSPIIGYCSSSRNS